MKKLSVAAAPMLGAMLLLPISVVNAAPSETPNDSCSVSVKAIPAEKLPGQLVTAAVGSKEELNSAIKAGVGNLYASSAGVEEGVLESLPNMQEVKDHKVGVSIDEEGGKVSRLKNVIKTPFPSAAEQSKMPKAELKKLVAARAAEMRKLGLTRDYAPVVDVGPSDFLGDRSPSSDPAKVSEYAQTFIEGLKESDIGATIKHFPGHGSTNSDTHQTAGETANLAELKKKDLVPYKNLLKDADPSTAVMVGHLLVPGLTEKGKVTSISPATMKLLREGKGYGGPEFNGMIVTDDLSGMKAVLDVLPAPQAAVAAVKAGADSPMITWSTDGPATIKALQSAKIPEKQLRESVGRIMAARGECSTEAPKEVDESSAETTESSATTTPNSGELETTESTTAEPTTTESSEPEEATTESTESSSSEEEPEVTFTPVKPGLS